MQIFHGSGPAEGITGITPTYIDSLWKVWQSDEPGTVYTTKAPKSVQSLLMEAGVIPNLYVGQNLEHTKWIPKKSWEFETLLDISGLASQISKKFKDGGILHLVFDAIDYDASFYCDDSFVCRQTGMFSPVDICFLVNSEITENLREKKIKIHFHKQPWWRTHALKCQMSFGWDFAPELRTVGIWKSIRIYYTGLSYFTDIYAEAVPISNSTPNATDVKIILRGSIEDKSISKNSMTISKKTLEIHAICADLDKTVEIKLNSNNSFEAELGTTRIPLWEPWSKGAPSVLKIDGELMANGEKQDEFHISVINRKVKWLRNPATFPGNENWTLEVNGKKYFLRGINWVPPDCLFDRITKEKYKALIQHAKDLNIDIFRVWGGGIEEKSEFYQLCDKIGIMIWQEFPFACTNYPKEPKYLALVEKECTGIAQRTRRHPSVIAYCGGNEYNPYINKPIIDSLLSIVTQYASHRHCFKASPFLGDDHNYKFWGARRKIDAYDIDGKGPFQMLTEFGMQSAPHIETLKQCLSDPNTLKLPEIAPDLSYHKADLSGLWHYLNYYGRKPETIELFISDTQELQAFAYKYAIEVCRSNWPMVSGVFPWQFSDPWPNVSWSIIDYNLKPKLVSEIIRIAYAPVLPMLKPWVKSRWNSELRKANLIVHNSTSIPFRGKIEYEVEIDKKIINTETKKIDVSPERPLKVAEIEVEAKPATVVRMRLYNIEEQLVVQNFSFPNMEPPRSLFDRIKDTIDVRFDSWWRKWMVKLMELDRIREETKEIERKRKIYT